MKKRQSLCLESLEGRLFLDGSIAYVDGTMIVTGTVGPDSITVNMRDRDPSSTNLGTITFNGRRYAIEEVVDGVNVNSLDGGDRISINADFKRSRDLDPPDRITINVDSGRGSDRVTVSTDQEVFVDSGSGNDTVQVSGFAPTEVYGGDGNDIITLRSNLFGTEEFDSVAYGEDGNDRLTSSGTMTHILDGGEGNNRFTGGNGTTFYNVAESPESRDTIFGGRGDDVVRALGVGYIKFTGGRNGDDQLVMSQDVYDDRSAHPGLTELGPDIEVVIE